MPGRSTRQPGAGSGVHGPPFIPFGTTVSV